MKIILLFLVIAASASAQEIKYQKRQKIDLGAISIDGELVSPGDFTVDMEKEKASELLFIRKNYNDRLRINIEYVF